MNLPLFPTPIGRGPSAPEARPAGLPLLRLGFRPFYLAAAAYAAVAVPVWVAVLLGWLRWPGAVAPLLWHAHEMIYGFAVAVIVGFLLTAGKAWTTLATPRGPALAALVLLWLAARLAAVVAPPAVFALLDLALLPAVAAVLARVLWRAGNRRNLPLVGLLLALALVNAFFHAAAAGWLPLDPRQPLHAALALVVMIECVMAGRVIPGFTMAATPGLKLAVPRHLAPAALAATAAALLGWVVAPHSAVTGVLLGAAALLQAALLWHWRPWRTRHRPILWVLHVAYAWIPLGLALLALVALSSPGWIAASTGIHALAVGATGVLIIGMMTRTARGHTGRPLQASRGEVAAYGLVIAAAVLRVGLPLVGLAVAGWVAAAVAWSAAFVVYLTIFGTWLAQPRFDGRDG